MSTDASREIETFYDFLGQQLQQGALDMSPEDSVEAFRARQRDLDWLKNQIKPALERCDRGEQAALFDVDDVKQRGRERLARDGITD